jgi:acetyl esterase/lipase
MIEDTIVFKIATGCAIHADIYRPADDATPRPAILWLHGGGLIFGSRRNLPREQAALYVNAGYVVVAADYRLAPETRLPAIVEDVADAWRWLLTEGPARYGVDPARVSVVGHSAGGYLALLAGHTFAPRPAAIVSFYGYGDIRGAWYSRPDPHYSSQPAVSEEEARAAVGSAPISESEFVPRFCYYLYGRQRGLWPRQVAGHDPDAEAGWFAPYCPALNVTPAYPPTLLIHGEEDTDVPVARSREMAAELARHDVLYELLTLPGRGHVFDGAQRGLADAGIAKVFRRVLGFLSEHTAAD